jgi:acylphosphatase
MADDDLITIQAFISGKVQGVFFRDHTCRLATSLELLGWVRNLPDSRVEVLATGKPENIQKLLDWLQSGPPKANVMGVKWEQLKTDNTFTNFSIQR